MGREIVFTCVYLCVKWGQQGPHHLLHRSTDKTPGLNIRHLLTQAAAASSLLFFLFSPLVYLSLFLLPST